MNRIKEILKKYKFWIGGAVLIVAVAGFYFYRLAAGGQAAASYTTEAVKKDTLVVSVSGSGQVSSSDEIGIKAKTSGDVVSLSMKNGQEVVAGTLLLQLDTASAQKALRDAQAGLDNAQLALAKLLAPADKLSLIQAENSLAQANESKSTAEDNLTKSYDDGFNNVANAFLDLPVVMAGLQDILLSKTLSVTGQWNIDYYSSAVVSFDDRATTYRNDAYNKYQAARQKYDANLQDYKNSSRFSSADAIESLIMETYETTKSIAEAIKSANNLLQFYKDTITAHDQKPVSAVETHLASLTSYTSQTNSLLLELLSAKSSIKSYQEAIVNAARSIEEKTESLANLKADPDELDVKTQELAVSQKADALADAKSALADCYVRAPFAGVITGVAVKKGDTLSVGTAAATLITKQQIAELVLNEVDSAKVAVGQKATLTFDAIDGLIIAGQVAEVDSVGTVSQGVVSYAVKISFDTQDERVKSGMTVSAAIVTDTRADVLMVPNSAIKTSGDVNYVEITDSASSADSLRRQAVTIGAANDSYTEILSGLSEGETVITKTVSATSSSKNSAQSRGGGEFFMMGR